MNTVADVLVHKTAGVFTISANATVFEAIAKMLEKNVGSIVITNDANSILGIFTERDYLRRTVVENRAAKTTFVRDVMSQHP